MFHVSKVNTRVVGHPNTRINLMQTVVRFDMWVTPKTSRPSFCPISKLSCSYHALNRLFSVLSCMVVKINVIFAEWRITERDYCQILLLGILCLAWHRTHYLFSDIARCCDGQCPRFGKYTLPQLQNRYGDCTEGSGSSNILTNF